MTASKPTPADRWRTLQQEAVRDLATRLVMDPSTPDDLLQEARSHLTRSTFDPSKMTIPDVTRMLVNINPLALRKLGELREALATPHVIEPAEALPESTHADDEPDANL